MKVLVLAFLYNLLFSAQAASSNENNENIKIIAGASSSNTLMLASVPPVVIHTQLQHYDQPTLKEYQECHENLEKCKKVCEGVESPVKCVKECPVCPFLVKEKIVIQGINDTEITPAVASPLNTTNIIRLTNQIRNIIESQQGNITYRNENIVHVHQNSSRVGGKFGLGFNNTDPCCIIVRSLKNCETEQFSTASRCHNKRHRVCGNQCKSRVMMAKRVTLCEKPVSFIPDEDYSEQNCQETVKYVPYQTQRKKLLKSQNKCLSIPSWPYVLCSQNEDNYEQSICRRCRGLTYYYILQRGMPVQCNRCFMPYARPSIQMYPPFWYPLMQHRILENEFEDDFDINLQGWRQEKSKCRLPNGSISENCIGAEGSGTASPPATSDPLKSLPEVQDEYSDYDSYEDRDNFDLEENLRRRRHTFTRSKYSRRYK